MKIQIQEEENNHLGRDWEATKAGSNSRLANPCHVFLPFEPPICQNESYPSLPKRTPTGTLCPGSPKNPDIIEECSLNFKRDASIVEGIQP